MIEKIGDDGPEDRYSLPETMIGDGDGHMCLAAAAGTGEHQPPMRITGERLGLLIAEFELLLFVRIGIQPLWPQIVEGESCQRPQVAVPLKPLDPIAGEFPQSALAGERPAEIGVLHRDVQDDPPVTTANGTPLDLCRLISW